MGVDLKVVHVRVFIAKASRGPASDPAKFRKSWILWITIRTLYRCIVQCSSLHGYDRDIVPWIVLICFDNVDFRLTLVSLCEVSRNKAQMQQPSFQKRGFARAKHQGPCCLLFLWCAPCWWLGSAKFRRSSAKEWAKVKVHFEGSGPASLAKKLPNQQQPVLRRGFCDASCMFSRLWTSYPW